MSTLADALNDVEWLEDRRKVEYHARLVKALANILVTPPGTVEYLQAKVRGVQLLRRLERGEP